MNRRSSPREGDVLAELDYRPTSKFNDKQIPLISFVASTCTQKVKRSIQKRFSQLFTYFSLFPPQILASTFPTFSSARSIPRTTLPTNLHIQSTFLSNSFLKWVHDWHVSSSSIGYLSDSAPPNIFFLLFSFSVNIFATSLGFSATLTPASLKASILL